MDIDSQELDELVEDHEDLVILDVRAAGEYARAHIPGALNVPLTELDAAADPGSSQRQPKLAVSRPHTVVAYSQHGERGTRAVARLHELGFEKAYNLAGGLDAWRAQGFAVIGGE
jgi:rhodanese-related sulfurtransferase